MPHLLRPGRLAALASCLPLILCLASPAVAQDASPAKLWDDVAHYTLIAKYDFANGTLSTLLEAVDDDVALLETIEASKYGRREQLNLILRRLRGNPQTAELGQQLVDRLRDARIAVIRDDERIKEAIDRLDDGGQAYRNAVELLQSAGQYAADDLLAVLEDNQAEQMHPFVVTAMIDIGEPVSYPLAEALRNLSADTQTQVSSVLGEIGHPSAIPYVREVVSSPKFNPVAKRAAVDALRRLLKGSPLPGDLPAAEMFLVAAEQQYAAGTRGYTISGFDEDSDAGIIWKYTAETGLVPIEVPAAGYNDARAMQSAEHALRLDPDLDEALSLFVTANLRRENRLDGAEDPSYAGRRPASFYAMLAGAERLRDVLDRALREGDVDLALDAIAGLADTASSETLLASAVRKPLALAMAYPDRRVRTEAAIAFAKAEPQEPFEASRRVVPVLTEAIGQHNKRYAVIIAADSGTRNDLAALADEAGYEPIAGETAGDIARALESRPIVDAVVTAGSVPSIEALVEQTSRSDRLANVPIVAFAETSRLPLLETSFRGQPRVTSMAPVTSADEFEAAVRQASEAAGTVPITLEEATAYADRAAEALRIAAENDAVYDIADAEPAASLGLESNEPAVVTAAGRVLAVIDKPSAQQSLAEAAIAADDTAVAVALLGSLAESARAFGQLIDDDAAESLVSLAGTTQDDEVAVAASRAIGALALPTSTVEQVVRRTVGGQD